MARVDSNHKIDLSKDWAKYQEQVTGKDYEETWLINGAETRVDGVTEDRVVDAKHINPARWDRGKSSYQEGNWLWDLKGREEFLDQAARLAILAESQGLTGVTYAVSHADAAKHLDAVLAAEFSELHASGFLEVQHVPFR